MQVRRHLHRRTRHCTTWNSTPALHHQATPGVPHVRVDLQVRGFFSGHRGAISEGNYQSRPRKNPEPLRGPLGGFPVVIPREEKNLRASKRQIFLREALGGFSTSGVAPPLFFKFRKGVGGRGLATNKPKKGAPKVLQKYVSLLVRGHRKRVQKRGLNLLHMKDFLAPTPSVRQPLFETSERVGLLDNEARKRSANSNCWVRLSSGRLGVWHVKGRGVKKFGGMWPRVRWGQGGASFLVGFPRTFARVSWSCPESLRKKSSCSRFGP